MVSPILKKPLVCGTYTVKAIVATHTAAEKTAEVAISRNLSQNPPFLI